MSGCANGGFGNGGFSLGEVIEDDEYLPMLEQGYNTGTTLTAPAVLEGASYILPRKIRLNRIIFRVSAFAAAATGAIFIYQNPDGKVSDNLNLVASVTGFTPIAGTVFEEAIDEGTVLLAGGLIYCLWGQDSGAGSFSLGTYNINSVVIVNAASTPSGAHPTIASSALSPAAPPATIDPQIGGDLTAVATDSAPIIRFRNV